MSISTTAIIHPSVILGEGVVIEDYCIIGCRGANPEPVETVIGDNAHIRSHTVIYAGNVIGDNFSTGNKVNIREGNVLGNNVSVGTSTVIEHSSQIHDNVRIHSQAFIPEFSIIKAHGWIGPNVVLTNAKYPMTAGAKKNLKGPVVHEHARVGANATILPGVEVGRKAIVGAGAVVTKNVAEGTIVAGNPAVFIREVSSDGS